MFRVRSTLQILDLLLLFLLAFSQGATKGTVSFRIVFSLQGDETTGVLKFRFQVSGLFESLCYRFISFVKLAKLDKATAQIKERFVVFPLLVERQLELLPSFGVLAEIIINTAQQVVVGKVGGIRLDVILEKFDGLDRVTGFDRLLNLRLHHL